MKLAVAKVDAPELLISDVLCNSQVIGVPLANLGRG